MAFTHSIYRWQIISRFSFKPLKNTFSLLIFFLYYETHLSYKVINNIIIVEVVIEKDTYLFWASRLETILTNNLNI